MDSIIFYIALYPPMVLLSLFIKGCAMLGINWWAPLFADEQGNLPDWLRWFQTVDASLDEAWQGGDLDPSWGASACKRYLARVYWLYRHPADGFDYWLLGVRFDANQWRVIHYTSSPQHVLFIALGNGFNVYYHGRFGSLKLGWAAWDRWDGKGWVSPLRHRYARIPLCFTFNPFNSFKRRASA